jgi:hypothetical protein
MFVHATPHAEIAHFIAGFISGLVVAWFIWG